MRIESFWAKGYRSLRDVRIDNLGAFNVFYGPNGSGKTNILEAIRTLIALTRVRALFAENPPDAASAHGSRLAIEQGLISRRDLCAYDRSQTIILGARFTSNSASPAPLSSGSLTMSELSVEIQLNWLIERDPRLSVSTLSSDARDFISFFHGGAAPAQPSSTPIPTLTDEDRRALHALLQEGLPHRAYSLIGADRYPHTEFAASPPDGEDVVTWHLREGRLKNALLAAQIGPSAQTRRRLDALRALLAGEPLHRPPFDPIQDLRTGAVGLRERLPEPNPEGLEIPIDLAGLGIAQIYTILAKAVLMGTRAVGIEEPEAHLHAPTSGRALRTLLVRLVEEKLIDQLFIATHSNLFDLDSTGYFDVSLKDGCTVVTRSDLTRIDREHLYEPGPAKHALEKLLQYAPEGEIVFRRPDGTGVSAKEMLRLLQEDDALAVSFLQDVHGAAVRMVKVQSKKTA
jgi:energy-coupling factor transporter ATP-binding protein EcfA2